MCLYGDSAYPLRAHLQGPSRGAARPKIKNYNTAMNGACTAVESAFGDIITLNFWILKRTSKLV